MADLLNPVATIIRFESSYCTNQQNPTPGSTASGCGGMLNSTWRSIAPSVGIDTAAYPSAKDAPIADQLRATAALYNRDGWQPWTCPGCDAKLTNYVNGVTSSGGGFIAPGSLSTAPVDYSTVRSAADVPAWLDANGGAVAGLSTTATANDVQRSTDIGKPFSYAYSLIIDSAAPAIAENIRKTQDVMQPWLGMALVLAVAITGLVTMSGNLPIRELWSRGVRFLLVSLFAGAGSVFYASYVQAVVMALPAAIAVAFGVQNAGPMGVFDDANATLAVIAETISKESSLLSPSSWGTGFLVALLLVVGEFALWFLAAPHIATAFMLMLTLVVGPIAIVPALFRALDRWVISYGEQILTLAVTLLMINVVVSIYRNLIAQLSTGFTISGNPDTDVARFAGHIGIIGVMAITVYTYLPRTISKIFGGATMALSAPASTIVRTFR